MRCNFSFLFLLFIPIQFVLAQANLSPEARELGYNAKNLFINHKKHCKIANVHSALAVGNMVESVEFGEVAIAGFVIGNKRTYFYRFDSPALIKKVKVVKKVRAVKRLVVWVPRKFTLFNKSDDRPTLRKKKLSVEETKEIMLKELVKRRKIKLLKQMYPEERDRIYELLKKYAPELPPDPSFIP